jgi:hypothetical protein
MTIVAAVICELKFCLLFGMGVKLGLQRQAEVVRESSAEEDILTLSGTRQQERAEDSTFRSFMICTPHQI